LNLAKKEALDLTLKNNEGIVEITMDDEYKESDSEKTSYMIENSLISVGDFEGEETSHIIMRILKEIGSFL